MKVAILTDGIWPYVIGGMQKHSYFLCKYFAKHKVRVLLVHTAGNEEEAKKLDCFSEEEKTYISSVFVQKPGRHFFPGHYIYESWLYSKKIYETLNGFPAVDFIIAKGMTAWYFLKNKKTGSPPVAINIHGYEFMQRKSGFKTTLESILLRYPLTFINRKADYVFSYGGKITGYITKLGVAKEKIIELPAAIEDEWMNERNTKVPDKRRFLFIGRYERRKGIEEINDCIRELAGKHSFSFSFVGPIPDSKRLTVPGVKYHGVIQNRHDLQAVLAQSDILVCPSYSEGMPNVILEGMANGCAVIATDVGAVSLLVDENTGWLVAAGDKQALKTTMMNAISMSPEMLQKKKMAAYRKIAEHFLWPNVSLQLMKAVEERIRK